MSYGGVLDMRSCGKEITVKLCLFYVNNNIEGCN